MHTCLTKLCEWFVITKVWQTFVTSSWDISFCKCCSVKNILLNNLQICSICHKHWSNLCSHKPVTNYFQPLNKHGIFTMKCFVKCIRYYLVNIWMGRNGQVHGRGWTAAWLGKDSCMVRTGHYLMTREGLLYGQERTLSHGEGTTDVWSRQDNIA